MASDPAAVQPMIEVTGLTFVYGEGPPVFREFLLAGADGRSVGGHRLLRLRQEHAALPGRRAAAAERGAPGGGRPAGDRGRVPASGWCCRITGCCRGPRCGRTWRCPCGWANSIGTRAGIPSAPRPYPRPDISPEQVEHWLNRLGIADLRDKYPSQISGGQRQRTAIARSLLQQPNLLLMDEPFSSLDALTREDLQRLTVELRAETGLTTVVVTHNIEEAVFLGQRILVLGRPPNTAAHVIENPAACDTEYRGQPAYWERCAEAARGIECVVVT